MFAKGTGRPGQGFFDTLTNLRNQSILKPEQDAVWTTELNAVISYYAGFPIKAVNAMID